MLLTNDIAVAAAMGLIGAVVFAAIGLVSGTDETTTLAPLTLLVVLLILSVMVINSIAGITF